MKTLLSLNVFCVGAAAAVVGSMLSTALADALCFPRLASPCA